MAKDEETSTSKKKKRTHVHKDTSIRTEYGTFYPNKIRPKGSAKIISGEKINLRYHGGGFKVKFTRIKPLTNPVEWIVTVEIGDWTSRKWECINTPSTEAAKSCAIAAVHGAQQAEHDLFTVLEYIERWEPMPFSMIYEVRAGWTKSRWKRFWKFLTGNDLVEQIGDRHEGKRFYGLSGTGIELLDELRESG